MDVKEITSTGIYLDMLAEDSSILRNYWMMVSQILILTDALKKIMLILSY